MGHSGGFWIWPESETESEYSAGDVEIEEPVVTEPGREPVQVHGAICSALGRLVAYWLIGQLTHIICSYSDAPRAASALASIGQGRVTTKPFLVPLDHHHSVDIGRGRRRGLGAKSHRGRDCKRGVCVRDGKRRALSDAAEGRSLGRTVTSAAHATAENGDPGSRTSIALNKTSHHRISAGADRSRLNSGPRKDRSTAGAAQVQNKLLGGRTLADPPEPVIDLDDTAGHQQIGWK